MASAVITTRATFTWRDRVQRRLAPGCAGDVCDLAAGILTDNPLTGRSLRYSSRQTWYHAGGLTALRYYSEAERNRCRIRQPGLERHDGHRHRLEPWWHGHGRAQTADP